MESSGVWELFKKTGNIGVYLLYKKMADEEIKMTREEQNSDANSNRGNCN